MDADRARTFICADEPESDGDESLLYYCVRIPPSIVKESGFLKGLSSTAGLARLPSDVPGEDFALWRKSSPNCVPVSSRDLARVLKVADAVADSRLEKWADVMGKRAAATVWTDASGDAMVDAILGLSATVRHIVVQRALRYLPAGTALLTMPPVLHPAIVSAMIDESGQLVDPPRLAPAAIPTADSFQHFMAQLQVLHTNPHPALRSLRLLNGALQASSAHVLEDVLTHHTQLSQLCLKVPTRPESMPLGPPTSPDAYAVPIVTALLPKLPFSPSLLDLQLHSTLPEQCLVPLTAILPQLTSLQCLKIDSVICGEAACGEAASSAVAAAKAYAQRWTRFLSAVAEHPALTSLLLSVHDAFTPFPWPAEFPRLQDLKLSLVPVCTGDLRVSPAYLALLGHDRDRMHASFPCLTSLHFRLAPAPLGMSTCLERWLPLGRTSAACDSMMDLRIRIEHLDHVAHDEEEEAALWQPFAGTVAACPNLTSFDICGIDTAASCPVVVEPYVPALLRLTRLRLAHLRSSWPASAWTTLAETLAPLTALREVQLGNHSDPDGHFMSCLLRTLAGAPHLTLLHLDWQMDSYFIERSVLPTQVWGAVYRQGLRKLRSLEVVHLRGEVQLHESEALWAGLATAPRLRELYLHALKAVTPEDVADFVAAAPSMQSLTHLHFGGDLCRTMGLPVLDGMLRAALPPQLATVTVASRQYFEEGGLDAQRLELEEKGIKLLVEWCNEED